MKLLVELPLISLLASKLIIEERDAIRLLCSLVSVSSFFVRALQSCWFK